jgi:hypothetical protein
MLVRKSLLRRLGTVRRRKEDNIKMYIKMKVSDDGSV